MKQKPALSAAALPFAVNRLHVDRISQMRFFSKATIADSTIERKGIEVRVKSAFDSL